MKIVNTAAMHQWGADDYSFGYIVKTLSGFEIRFLASQRCLTRYSSFFAFTRWRMSGKSG